MVDTIFITLVCGAVLVLLVITNKLFISGNGFFSMDKILRNTIIAGITVMTFSVSYYFLVSLPKNEELKSQLQATKQAQEGDLSKSPESFDNQQTVDVNQGSQEEPLGTLQPSKINDVQTQYQVNAPDSISNSDLEQAEKQRQKDAKKAEEDYKKSQEAAYKAQLSLDKAAYNSALEKLTRDYEYARDKVNAEIIKNGLTEPYPDCADGTRDEQRCQINNRAYAPYQLELDYLEKTYKANVKALNAAKYW